jgi:hypothetical protein
MSNAARAGWVAGLVTFLVAIGVATHARGEGSGHAGGDITNHRSTMGVSDVVGAFRQPRSAVDWLPATATTEVRDFGPPGIESQSSILALSRGLWKVYLTPAPSSVCMSIVDPDGGATARCRSREDLESGLAFPAVVREGCQLESRDEPAICTSALIYGVVPNGVDQVTVDVGSGRAPTADIQRNAYLIEVSLSQAPSAVRYDGPLGEVVQPVPVPRN